MSDVIVDWRAAAPPHNDKTPKWDQKLEPRDLHINVAGKNPKAKVGPLQGWNTGDIDFEADGSVFIRNPYLANAIEEHIRMNYEKLLEWENKRKQNLVAADEAKPFLFKLTRDEGWSGEKQNVVC